MRAAGDGVSLRKAVKKISYIYRKVTNKTSQSRVVLTTKMKTKYSRCISSVE